VRRVIAKSEVTAQGPGTELADATVGTIRVKLFKVAAAVKVSVRRVSVQLCSAFPMQEIFGLCTRRLQSVARETG
jgi:hypothetical protein